MGNGAATLYTTKLDAQVKRIKRLGASRLVRAIVVSPDFFEGLRSELNAKMFWDETNKVPYFLYGGFTVCPHEDCLVEELALIYFDRAKVF
jgi:hypothetical protein